jgi:hypothetical protein
MELFDRKDNIVERHQFNEYILPIYAPNCNEKELGKMLYRK